MQLREDTLTVTTETDMFADWNVIRLFMYGIAHITSLNWDRAPANQQVANFARITDSRQL